MNTSCPWPSNEQLADFCEADLCSFIVEPGNTWSNLGFIVVGIWIISDAARKKRGFLGWIGVVAVLTGAGSAMFHATAMPWAGNVDILAMYLGTGTMTALNIHRWLKWNSTKLTASLIVVSLGLSVGIFLGPVAARFLYVLGAPCCYIEARLFFRDRKSTLYRDYLFAWLFVGFAFLAWWLDLNRIWCDPNNHVFSGHVLWHWLAAIAFYFFYRFYSQFEPINVGQE